VDNPLVRTVELALLQKSIEHVKQPAVAALINALIALDCSNTDHMASRAGKALVQPDCLPHGAMPTPREVNPHLSLFPR
jgi:hypothetical protein